MGRALPDSDVAAAKLRIKALSDPETRREAMRHYDSDARIEMFSKIILLVVIAVVCGIVVAFSQ